MNFSLKFTSGMTFTFLKNILPEEISNRPGTFYTPCIAACGAAAEHKNPLISPIVICAPLSTLDDFEGKE